MSRRSLSDLPRALDLFCGAGGASTGLRRAGFHVTGIDIEPQPNYAGDLFIQADALAPPVDPAGFAFIWASPKCQAHTMLRVAWNRRTHEDQIPQTRALLVRSGRFYVIENVPGAPLMNPVMLCGAMFGLGAQCLDGRYRALARHRLFESNILIDTMGCQCAPGEKIGVYGKTGGLANARRPDKGYKGYLPERREALGLPSFSNKELAQAIPPAYAEHIGRTALRVLAACAELGL